MSGLPDLARYNKKEDIVRLLQQGADVNEKDSNGYTALYCACLNIYTEITEILLQNNKINANLQDNYGSSPFYTACWNNRYECALIMLKDARVDINLTDYWGWSPLMRACYFGHTKTVQLLISFGRKIDILKKSTRDWNDIKSGSTALDVAKQTNNTAVVQLLQQYQNSFGLFKFLERYLSSPKETQQTLRNQLNLKGNKIKYKS